MSANCANVLTVYRLPLPSGGAVRARKASLLVLAGAGILPLSLVAVAVEATGQDAARDPPDLLRSMTLVCQACLVDRQLRADDLPVADRMALYSWATAPGEDGAAPDGELSLRPDDFAGLVKGPSALFLDTVCRRYGQRPSQVLGIDDHELALPLDLAVAFRGARREADGATGEVEVEDVWGGKHTVPSTWLSGASVRSGVDRSGARVTHADDYARTYGAITLSAGGVEGGDGMIGPMPGPDGQRHWH